MVANYQYLFSETRHTEGPLIQCRLICADVVSHMFYFDRPCVCGEIGVSHFVAAMREMTSNVAQV
jgi:hypothetical protein